MTCFVSDAFKDFKDVLSCKHDTISLRWITSELNLNVTNVEYSVFQCGENQFYVTHPRPIIGRANKVTLEVFNKIVENVKVLCTCVQLPFSFVGTLFLFHIYWI
jgi:hypothetical protein